MFQNIYICLLSQNKLVSNHTVAQAILQLSRDKALIIVSAACLAASDLILQPHRCPPFEKTELLGDDGAKTSEPRSRARRSGCGLHIWSPPCESTHGHQATSFFELDKQPFSMSVFVGVAFLFRLQYLLPTSRSKEKTSVALRKVKETTSTRSLLQMLQCFLF